MHIGAILLAAVIASVPYSAEDAAAVAADLASIPKEQHHKIYYLTTAAVPIGDRERLAAVGKAIIASSSSQRLVERVNPVPLPGGRLWRLDLDEVKWDAKQFRDILERENPYGGHCLVVRWDWLTVLLSDTTQSDAHYRLLYNDENIDREGFEKFFGVNTDPDFLVGLAEGKSGVNVSGKRFIQDNPTDQRGYYFITLDSVKPVDDNDVLERLDLKNFKFDASEIIAGREITSLKEGKTGILQYYLLADDEGKRAEEAPPNIATDHTRFRGQAAVRNFGSCVTCHTQGLNFFTVDEYRQTLQSGTLVLTKDKATREKIELIHRLTKESLESHNERYNLGIQLVCGLTAPEFSKQYSEVVKDYDADLSIHDVAREAGAFVEDIRYALGYYSLQHPDKNKLSARLARLAVDDTEESRILSLDLKIPRINWEQDIKQLKAALKLWRSALKVEGVDARELLRQARGQK